MAAMDQLRAGRHRGHRPHHRDARRRAGGGGRQVMAHAHQHLGADKVVKGEVPHASCGHERHAAHRRAARAARHLHGGPAAHAEGRRHQPAGRDARRRPTSRRTSARSCSSTRPTSASRSTSRTSRLPSSRRGCATSSSSARTRRCSSSAPGTLRYGDIIEVIDAAKGAGVEKVGIVTEGMRKAGGASTGSQLEFRSLEFRIRNDGRSSKEERPFSFSGV